MAKYEWANPFSHMVTERNMTDYHARDVALCVENMQNRTFRRLDETLFSKATYLKALATLAVKVTQ